MKRFHIAAAVFQFVCMALFLWLGSRYGGPFYALAGWCLFWGAWSTQKLWRRA